MNIAWFRDLGNLAQTGNFSQAARLGNISQPAFSRRIQALEAWVGAGLVDRSRHPVKLTVAGQQMLEAAGKCFAEHVVRSRGACERCVTRREMYQNIRGPQGGATEKEQVLTKAPVCMSSDDSD